MNVLESTVVKHGDLILRNGEATTGNMVMLNPVVIPPVAMEHIFFGWVSHQTKWAIFRSYVRLNYHTVFSGVFLTCFTFLVYFGTPVLGLVSKVNWIV